MNKMKKLLSVLLAVVIALSCMSVAASAAKTAYKTVDELTALDAYSPYGQVTRLSLEERTSIVLDFLDNVLPKANINMGEVFNVLGLSVTIDLTSVDRLCYSLDTIKDTFTNTLATIAMGIVNLGILESLEPGSWATGMSRDGTAQFTILSEILELLSANTTLVGKVFTDGLDLGLVNLGDMSAIENIIMDLPGLVKGLIFPLIERWDDTLAEVKYYDNNSKGNGNVNSVVNTRVKALFSDDMSITTIKYDVNGNMTSEHNTWKTTATGTAAPGTPSDTSPRCYYQILNNGKQMKVWHIVDAKEAEDSVKANKANSDVEVLTAYTYVEQDGYYYLEQEVEGSETYVWKSYQVDEDGNLKLDSNGEKIYSSTLKWYNDDSALLPGFSGDNFDLITMSAGDLLYTFMPKLFDELALVVLNGSVKKLLAEFTGAKFSYVGKAGLEADDVVAALGSDDIFVGKQGDYVFEWSDYAVIGGVHYYRYLDDLYVADLSATNNYFDIINWNFEVTSDLLNKYIPANADDANTRILTNVSDFLADVGNLILLPSAATVDEVTGFEAAWTRTTFNAGNANLVDNIKRLAQDIVKLAPQHIFGDDYDENPRCYYNMFISNNNDTVLAGIAAQLVDIIMPSMTLPTADQLIADNTKVGAILAAVIREFAAQLTPEYNYDALIYADFGTTSADKVKTFVSGKNSSYWFDVCLTMGINVGFEYLRAFADMGEGTTEWNNFVTASGYKVDGGNFTEADLKLTATNNYWEGMLDYIVDWALTTDKEWCWKMANLVNVENLTINLNTVEDPWAKVQQILGAILPVDEILTVEPASGQTKIEHFLREDLILGIVDLKWDHLINTIQFNGSANYFRNDNVLNNLATLLKTIVNSLFKKVGGGSYELIPSVITNFDNLANQANLVTMIKALVGVLYKAFVTNGLADTVFPFLNFLFGWKTDPQKIADPQIWTSFRDGNDYAFQWKDNGVYPSIEADATIIKVLNNSAGMLETHRNSTVTDKAYDIQIKSVTSDATTNTLKFTYGDGLISPWETLDIKIGGTYKGEESTTITIAYDYVGKDGSAIGGTQYTSITVLFSDQYEDANVDGRWSGDDDDDYTGTNQYKKYVFTEDLYTSVTTYEPTIFYVKPSVNLGSTSKNFTQICANGEQQDCNGNITKAGDVPTGQSTQYFEWIRDQNEAGWEGSISDGNPASGRLYKAKAGVTANTEFPYGDYDMGNMAVQYGGTIVFEVNFIYYNSYNLYDIYTENKDNGYNANQGVDAAIYNEYNDAWKTIVYGATYPMMTEMSGAAADKCYVNCIQPYIPAAIERFEAAKEAYETALAEAQAAGSAGASLPAYVTALQAEIDNDYIVGNAEEGKEINFQDVEFYEYFNYNDVKVAAENLYRTYLAPSVMDQYYIQGSGISEAELDLVAGAEASATKKAAILASRLENNADAIAASQAAKDEWKMPITSKLIVEDMESRLAYYKQFVVADAAREDADLLYFLNQEIAHVEAQGLVAEDYEEVTWGRYEKALADAKAVANGTDAYASYNSRIFDVKWALMVAYKQLLKNDDSLIQAGGTADLLANIEIAEEIFDSMDAADGTWVLKDGVDADEAYAELIKALGYEYQARYSKNDAEVQNGKEAEGNLKWNDKEKTDPMMFDLYADSAYEYANNDRPNRSGNQAKVDAANAKLEEAIANFEKAAVAAPELAPVDGSTGVIGDVTTDETTGVVEGFIYGVKVGDSANNYFELVDADAGTVEWTASAGGATNGTGATATVKDADGNTTAVYTLVVFGDVNGDANITGADKTAVDICLLANSTESLTEASSMAANVNGDTGLTGADKTAIDICLLSGDATSMTVNPYVS